MDLPQEPTKPLDSDCCGQGCVPCVFDIYDEEMKIWQRECDRIKHGLDKQEGFQEKDNLLGLTEYHTFKIEEVKKETSDTLRFRISLPHGCNLGLRVGQHIVVRGHANGETVTRQYTPISDIAATSYFELMIKVYVTGKMSECVRGWGVGHDIEIRGPFGHLDYCNNKYRKLLMLCVGTGIAPMSQVIQYILNNESDETRIELLYGCRTYKDILLKTELDEWSRFWNFSVIYNLTQETGDTLYRYGDKVKQSRINMTAIEDVLGDDSNFFVLICGTRSFERNMINCMDLLGIPPTKYHKF